MKKLLLTLVGIVCSLGIWADEVTVTVVNKAWSYSVADKITVSTAEGGFQNAKSDDPAYGKVTKANGITISSDNTITAITVTANTGYAPSITASVGGGSQDDVTYTWTGSTNSVQLKPASDWRVNTIVVTYTQATTAKLNAPTIEATANGNVTISGDSRASSIKYTIDGTDPSATNGNTYSSSFSVTEDKIVKAICLGDGTTTSNSNITSQQVLVAGITVATPTIATINGTVKISCATVGATIKYSTDGSSYNNYTGVFTLTSDATVYAKAVRENCADSEIASQAVTAVSKGEANESITLYYDGDKLSKPEYSTLTFGDWKLELLNSGKDWSQGANDNAKVNVNGEDKNAIKVSNGAQNRIVVPEGLKVTRLTFYSVVNGTPASNVLWGEVNGIKYSNETQIPMENTKGTTPDVRAFGLDEAEGNITFTNAGVQLCFAVVVDYINASALAESDLAVESATANVEKGKTATVAFTTTSTGAVTATSNKTDIATVDVEGENIVITGVAAGTATITVSQASDETYAAGEKTIAVTVTDPTADVVVYNWNTVGTTTLAGSAATGTVNIKNVSTNGIKFANGLSATNYLKIESNNGGFKAGDVVTWTGCINNSSADKQGAIMIVSNAADGNVQLACSELFNNTNTTTVEATTGSFTLTEDAECLYIGRATSGISGATATWLTQLTVSRAATIATTTLNAQGFGTFSAAYPVKISGAKVYGAKLDLTNNKIIATEIESGEVPAGNGVIITGEAGASVSASYKASVSAIAGNDLKATTNADGSLAAKDGDALVLSGNTFKNFTGAAFAANKAYFPYTKPNTEAKSFTIVFEDNNGTVTSINTIESANEAVVKTMKNGKLVIVKGGKAYNAVGAEIK